MCVCINERVNIHKINTTALNTFHSLRMADGRSAVALIKTQRMRVSRQDADQAEQTIGQGVFETLVFYNCPGLTRMPVLPITTCAQLQRMELIDCHALTSIPEKLFEHMPCLTVLHFDGCDGIQGLPANLGRLSALRELRCTRLGQLTSLPAEIQHLSRLVSLRVEACPVLTGLPDLVSGCQALEELVLGDLPFVTVPIQLCQLGSLRRLTLCRMPLASVPAAISQLKTLTQLAFTSCPNLTQLPDTVGTLSALTMLSVENCTGLTALPDSITQLTHLKILDIMGCTALETLPESIGDLPYNVDIFLARNFALKTLPLSLTRLGCSVLCNLAANAESRVMTFPPLRARELRWPGALHQFMSNIANRDRNYRRAMLAMIAASRAKRLGLRRLQRIPDEVWGLVIEALMDLIGDMAATEPLPSISPPHTK